MNYKKSPDKENIAFAISDLEQALVLCTPVNTDVKKIRKLIESAIDVLENGY
jgi:hypothetical protein